MKNCIQKTSVFTDWVSDWTRWNMLLLIRDVFNSASIIHVLLFSTKDKKPAAVSCLCNNLVPERHRIFSFKNLWFHLWESGSIQTDWLENMINVQQVTDEFTLYIWYKAAAPVTVGERKSCPIRPRWVIIDYWLLWLQMIVKMSSL